jgi:hypothetical protein
MLLSPIGVNEGDFSEADFVFHLKNPSASETPPTNREGNTFNVALFAASATASPCPLCLNLKYAKDLRSMRPAANA